jgi:hypothetical protein
MADCRVVVVARVMTMSPFHRPLFFADCGSLTGPLSYWTQAYLRRPSKHRASRFNLDGLRYRASVIR